MKNILTIDLEDWHQLIHRKIRGDGLPSASKNVFRQTSRLLQLLEDRQTKATFFVMGALADQYPKLVREVSEAGHEIGSHGYEHLLVYGQTPTGFRADTRHSKRLLEDLTGQPIRGYRAAEFSIRRDSLWALDILAEVGFEYDSSIFPIRHRRYGIPGFSSKVARYELRSGRSIVEIPLSSVKMANMRLPVAGGGYLRYLPKAALGRVVGSLNRSGLPMVAYGHPYEFDTETLNTFETLDAVDLRERMRGYMLNVHQNIGRSSSAGKFEHLLDRFNFTTCYDYLASEEVRGSSEVL